jgi:O-Antigen ligase
LTRLRKVVQDSPGAVPAAVCIAVFTWFAAEEGGFLGTTWLPGTLLLLATLAICLVSLPSPRPTRAILAAVLLLAAYAAWSYLSILWADEQGIAWDGANRTLLYAVVLALCALWPIRAVPAAVLAGAWGLAVAGIGVIELLRVDAAADPDSFFRQGRLEQPTGYANANVALWFSAIWPCLVLAGRQAVPVPLRGLLLAACGPLIGLTILGQSRSWFFAIPFVLVLALVLVPGRGRTLAALAAIGIALLAMAGPLLDLYDRWESASHPALVDDATRAILFASAGLLVAGVLAALVDRRLSVPRQTARRISAAAVAATAVLALGGLVAFAASKDDPVGELSDAWQEFKESGGEPGDFGSSRFGGSLGNYRYDYWRVAWENFERHPLIGVGADNYELDYLARGNTGGATPRYTHSLELRVISHTGLVGALLLGGAVVLALVAAAPFAVRARAGLGPATVGACLMVFVYWVVHGSADWLWEFPALGGSAFALLGVAAALASLGRAEPAAGIPRPALAAGVAIMLVASASLTLPWLAERDLRNALRTADTDPLGALDRLDRARGLNPLSANFDKASGVILARQGRLDEAALEYREVLERNPRDSYAELQLGAIASELEQPTEALLHLRRASELAPTDRNIRDSLLAVERGRKLDVNRLDRQITREIDVKLGRN